MAWKSNTWHCSEKGLNYIGTTISGKIFEAKESNPVKLDGAKKV